MALIKIKPNCYINSDLVESVIFFRDAAAVNMHTGRSYGISKEAASYLLVEMDTKDAVILPDEAPSEETEVGGKAYGGTD